MQASLRYQTHQLESPDFAIPADDPVEIQLASAMAWISELKTGKQNLESKLLTAARELEIKQQLLRNAEVREQELKTQLLEYAGAGSKAGHVLQADPATNAAKFGTEKCIGLVRGVLKSYAFSFARGAKAFEAKVITLASFTAQYRQQLRQHFPGLFQASECPTQKP